MNCLKCGKETPESQVFCDSCLEVMCKYPIKPGTVVHIPQREKQPSEKKPARNRDLSPKEQLRRQRSLIHWLTITVAVLTSILCLLAGLLFYTLGNQPTPNYPGFSAQP